MNAEETAGERYEREWHVMRVLARLSVDQAVRFWLPRIGAAPDRHLPSLIALISSSASKF